MLESFLCVFALAIVEVWAAIPLGLYQKLPPVLVGIAAISGGIIGSVAAIVIGSSLRYLIFWRAREATENSRVSKWLVKKGPYAIGILGPLIVGPIFSALLIAAADLPRKLSFTLLSIGIVLWTVIIVALGGVSMSFVTYL